jgi:hypothetical protein
MGQEVGWHIFELIMDLATVFKRTGIALFKYVENTGVLISPQPELFPFQLFYFQFREQVVVRRGQIRRIG